MASDSIALSGIRFLAEGMSEQCPGILSRQTMVPGFEQDKLEKVALAFIGAGGLGGEIALGGVRKGYKDLTFYDGDSVEASNLPRQRFYVKDIHEKKAVALGRNLQREAISQATLSAVPLQFQQAYKQGLVKKFDVAVCGVDNNPARTFVSRYCYHRKIPAVFVAVSADADNGYVFVQEPGGPCFGCLFPDALQDQRIPCDPTPASIDILKIVSGVVLYAIDTLIMGRKRGWNYREFFLAYGDDRKCVVPRRSGCELCWKSEFVDVG